MIHYPKTTRAAVSPLSRELSFYCEVEGKALIANVTQTRRHPDYLAYHIRFSDGYTSAFYSVDNRRLWYDVNGREEYVEAIIDELRCFGGFLEHRKIYCLPVPIQGVLTNFWVKQDAELDEEYHVWWDGLYHFSLSKGAKGWEAFTNRDYVISEELARELVSGIERYSK